MTSKYFEDFQVGETFRSIGTTITETHIVNFVSLAAIVEPYFSDMEFIKQTPYLSRIAPGPFVTAVSLGQFARLGLIDETSFGMVTETTQFKMPVRPNDTLITNVEVVSKQNSDCSNRGIIDFRLIINNHRCETVANIMMKVFVKKRTI